MVHSCSTETIAKTVREYEGVKRKHAIGEMVKALKIDAPHVVAAFGEDAAVIEHHGEALLLAADGIWSRLMEAETARTSPAMAATLYSCLIQGTLIPEPMNTEARNLSTCTTAKSDRRPSPRSLQRE